MIQKHPINFILLNFTEFSIAHWNEEADQAIKSATNMLCNEKMGSKLVGGGVVLLPSVMVLFCTFVSVPLSVKVP